MKLIFTISCLLLASALITKAQEQSNVEQPQIRDYKFDEWGDIPFNDEKARLDFIAQQLQREPEKIMYMEIYAGKRACVGEAQARAVRAKNYLVNQKKIDASRIKWRDGGYHDEVTVVVWLVLPDWPILRDTKVFTYLKPVGVKFDGRCKVKYRGKP
jgi:hypothetical protein